MRKSGGFVLLVVLALLVVLTVVASIAYSRASDQVVMSTALKRQALSEGLHSLRMDGISKLRKGITTAEEILKETAADNV